MKILLDECIDRRLAREFSDFEVNTVPQMGWAGIKNGALLKLAEENFDLFITVDRNLSFQQNIARYNIAVVVLRCRTNRLSDLKPFAALIVERIEDFRKGEASVIEFSS